MTFRSRRWPIAARVASSWRGATSSPPHPVVGKPTMHGACLLACCHGRSTADSCSRIPAPMAVGSIAGRDNVWTAADEAAFFERAPARLHLALLLALWTGQRQGDLLRLPWSAYDGKYIRLHQSKTGTRVPPIPVGAPLKAALDAAPRLSPIILTNISGKPWSGESFRGAWQRACKRAGIVGLTFHDLRGTAVTRLAIAECTEAQIATITGHSLQGVRSILDTHYLARDPALAESAIAKLEQRTKSSQLASQPSMPVQTEK
jgi:integrase